MSKRARTQKLLEELKRDYGSIQICEAGEIEDILSCWHPATDGELAQSIETTLEACPSLITGEERIHIPYIGDFPEFDQDRSLLMHREALRRTDQEMRSQAEECVKDARAQGMREWDVQLKCCRDEEGQRQYLDRFYTALEQVAAEMCALEFE